MPAPTRRPLWLLAVFAVALALRAWHIHQIAAAPFFDLRMGDAASYDAWARTILAGDWIGHDVFYQAPLYPYFLALVYATAGSSVAAVRIVQAVLGAASSALLADAGWRLFSRRAGLVAGFMLASYPPAIFLDTIVQKSALDLFFLCLVLWLVAAIVERPRAAAIAGLGAALGCLMLTRENASILIAPLVLWLALLSATRRARRVLLFAAGLAVVVGPVAVRNAVVGGELAITTAQFGPNFYIGNNPDADGTYKPLVPWRGNAAYERQDAARLAERAAGRTLNAGEVSAYYRDRALDFIRAEPVRWARLLARKTRLLLNTIEITDTEDQYTYAQWSWPLKAEVLWNFGTLLPLALVGVWITRSDWRRLWVLHAIVVLYAASVVLFYVFGRYRFPLVPPLILFAAAAVAALPAFVKGRSTGELAACAAMLIVVGVFCEWPAVETRQLEAVMRYNVGAVLDRQGRTGEAIVEYQAAAALDPRLPMVHNNLGLALGRVGRLEEAADQFRETIRLLPGFAEAHNNLGVVLANRGEFEKAVAELEQAARLDPAYAEPKQNLARLHGDRAQQLAAAGQLSDALAEIQAGLKIDPNNANLLNGLGILLANAGRVDEAAAAFERALAIEPGNATVRQNLARLRAR